MIQLTSAFQQKISDSIEKKILFKRGVMHNRMIGSKD